MDDNLIIEDNVLKGYRQSKIITVTNRVGGGG